MYEISACKMTGLYVMYNISNEAVSQQPREDRIVQHNVTLQLKRVNSTVEEPYNAQIHDALISGLIQMPTWPWQDGQPRSSS